MIVTFNVAEGIEAKHPDDFVLDLLGLSDRLIYTCVQQIADSRTNPPDGVHEVLAQLERSGLVESAAYLRLT